MAVKNVSAPTSARAPIDFLLLEDCALLARGLSRALSPFGIVLHVSTCEEALRVLAENTPAALVADVALPDGNGLDVAAYAIAHRHVRRVLIMSGGVDRASLNRANALGATYLVKPVDLSMLRRFAMSAVGRVESAVHLRATVWASRYRLTESQVSTLSLAALGRDLEDEEAVKELLARTGDRSLTGAAARLHLEIHAERSPEDEDGGEPQK